MNNIYTTTLSSKELEIIEKLIMQHGNVVSFDDVYRLLKDKKSRQEVKNFVSKLTRKGWFIRIKKGVFVISDISGRGVVAISQLTIAQIINSDSYISFEAALQHYGMFDQYLRVITSVGQKKAYSKRFDQWLYRYIKAKNSLFLGFEEFSIDGRLVKIASKEKIIIDFLIYRRSVSTIHLILDVLKNHQDEFSVKKLIELSRDASTTTVRSLGFIFDLVGINSEKLHKLIASNRGHSFITSDSDIFNSKWRIYVDKYLENYK